MAQRQVSVRIGVEADNLDAVRQKLEALGVTVKAVGNDNSVDKLRRSFEGLEGRLDPAARATQRLARDTDILNKNLAAGTVTQERYNQLLARSQQAHAQAAAGMGAATSSAGSFRGAMGNLGAQIQDVTVQAQMGTSAFIIMAQQGPQIASAFGPAGAVIGAFVAIASVAAGAIFSLGQNADDTTTSFTSYTKALEFAKRASDEMKGASEGVKAALEAEGRAATDAAQKRLAKADAELKALEVGMLGTADAASAAGAAITYLFQNSKVKELRQEVEVLRGTLGQYNDGARDARLATEQGNTSLRDARGVVEDYRESLRQQIAEAKLTADAEDLSSAGKLRARLETEALTKARAAGRMELDAGTRSLIDELVKQQERIDQLQEDEKASNKAGTAAETLAKQRARVVAELDRDVDAQKRLAEIAGMGAAEQRAANEQTRIAAELAKAHTTESTAEGKAIAAKVKEAERWKAVAADTKTLDAAKTSLKYAQDELALNTLLPGARERAVRSLQIQREATERWGEAASEVKTQWVGLQERIADTQAIKKFQDDVRDVAKDIGKDVSENLWDQFTGEAKAQDALTIFKNLFKRIAIEALNANIILPIVTQVVGSAPSLFGISSAATGGSAGSQTANGQGGSIANGGMSQLIQGGQNLYSGITGSTSSTLAGAGTYLAESSLGHSWGLSTAYPMMTSAPVGTGAGGTLIAGEATKVGTAYAANSSGTALSSGLGAIGAAAPYGMLGGMGGAYLSNTYMGGSKVGGAVTGAALGVGTYAAGTAITGALGMGAAASAAGVSGMAGATAALSAIPVYGWIAAAVLAAVMAAVGSQKPSVGPNAQGNVIVQNGRYAQGPSAADNGGDDSNVKTVTAALAQGFNTLADTYGLKIADKNFGYWEGGTEAATGNGVHNDPKLLIRRMVNEGISASDPNSSVAKALASDAAKNVDDLETLQKYLDVAKKIDTATEAFAELNKSLAQVQASAKTAAADGFKSIDDEIKTADTIGLGTAYRNSLEKSIRSTFEGAVEAATPWETAMAQLRGSTDAWIEAVTRWNVGVSEAEIRADAAAKATKLRAQAMEEYNAALYQAQGRDYLTTLAGIGAGRDTTRRNFAALGVDDAAGKADALVTAQLTNAMSGLGLAALSDVTTTLGGAVGTLAETMRLAAQATATEDLTVRSLKAQGRGEEAAALELSLTQQRAYAQAVKDGNDAAYLAGLRYVQGLDRETAAKERQAALTAYNADLLARTYAAVGQDRIAQLLSLDQRQAVELSQARTAGRDTTQLQRVQLAERETQSFQLAKQDLLDAYDEKIAAEQDYIATLTDGAVKVAQSARQFRSAFDALALNDNAPLSAFDRLAEARRQFETAYRTMHAATASDAAKEAAGKDLQSLAPTLVQLAKGFYGSTDASDYDRVRAVLAEFGDVSALGVDTAEQQLETAQEALKETQRARAEAASFGQRQIGLGQDAVSRLNDLNATMLQSHAIMQAALSPLNQQTGTQTTATVDRMLQGLTAQTLPAIMTWARAQGSGTVQAVIDTADQRLGWQNNPYRYTSPVELQPVGQYMSADAFAGVMRGIGFTGPMDKANSWIAAYNQQTTYEAAVRAWAHEHGVPGFAAGGIIPHSPGAIPGVDSVPLIGMPGEGVVNLRGMGVLGADGLAALNSGRWPANDRRGGSVTAFRAGGAGASDGGTAPLLAELRRQNALLERLIVLTEEGDADNAAATREGAVALTKAFGARTGRAADPVGSRLRTANG
ncbi:hypothetical protein [Azospirillum doebereinerae]|uniref:Bacteriophage tail tape measure N-terminal domain-containing protein n=1 Tax=Azospirillum doebereinerae TaxID=92933 RepID=A0A433J4Y0_9PROT|nr:hypothetical protein [Azospirillum doebereinerae]RUQ67463.1 hypothetical protein EJ913_19770 [Azospirillum doebereinerae]